MIHRFFLSCIILLAISSMAAAAMRAGFAERDISPKPGMERPGGYVKSIHQAQHDPCKVRVAVFDDGTRKVALVGVDALMIPRRLVLDVRRAVSERCGIAPDAVLIGASHTHSGGPTGMVQPGQFDHAEPLVQDLAYNHSSAADPNYLASTRNRIIEAIAEANERLSNLTYGFGSGTESQVSFNRRHRMKNGLAYTHPGAGNPDMLGYAGPIDPEVGVIGAWDTTGRLVGCVVNFACHATTAPGGASADYIYYIEQVIRGVFGEHVVMVFLNGASGDVTQVDNLSPHTRPRGGKFGSRLVGGRVGAEAVKVLLGMWARTNAVSLDARADVLRIERRKPHPDRLAVAYEIVRDPNARPNPFGKWVWAKETVMLDALIQSEPVVDVEVQAVAIGPAVFVTTPAEYFCQFGLEIKAASRFPLTYPVSLANGCVGYVPTGEAFGPGGGGYETRLTSYSNLRIDAGRMLADRGIELANAMEPGSLPEPPPAAAFKNTWSYGNVGPQVD